MLKAESSKVLQCYTCPPFLVIPAPFVERAKLQQACPVLDTGNPDTGFPFSREWRNEQKGEKE